MTWPTVPVVTTGMDAGTDTPPRDQILKMAQNLNALVAHVSTDAQSVIGAANLAAMRTALAVYSKTEVDALLASAEKVGSIKMWPVNTPPAGWLKRNGAALSRTTYAALFAVIGTTFGAGDGSTTFNLPDDRANAERGWDDGRGIDSGRAFGSEQLGQNESHAHGVNDPGHSHLIYLGFGSGSLAYPVQDGDGNAAHYSQTTTASATGISIQAQGGTEARMRNRAYLPIIKYQ